MHLLYYYFIEKLFLLPCGLLVVEDVREWICFFYSHHHMLFVCLYIKMYKNGCQLYKWVYAVFFYSFKNTLTFFFSLLSLHRWIECVIGLNMNGMCYKWLVAFVWKCIDVIVMQCVVAVDDFYFVRS